MYARLLRFPFTITTRNKNKRKEERKQEIREEGGKKGKRLKARKKAYLPKVEVQNKPKKK